MSVGASLGPFRGLVPYDEGAADTFFGRAPDAEALVRTSVMAVNNAARMTAYQNNPDVVRGVQALVTFDSRTTIICLGFGEGAMWDLDDNPLPESTFQDVKPPGPPFHFNCRTTLIAVLRSGADILRRSGVQKRSQVKGMSDDMRKMLDGKPAAPTFRDGLATDNVTDAVLKSAKTGRWEKVKQVKKK